MKLDNYECDGQMDIFDFLKKPIPVDIRGICDDAYCPTCGREFDETRGEIDIDCPECGTRLDWKHWHILND